MKIEEFIEKCEQSENLELPVKDEDEYQIKIVKASEDVKEHIINRLLSVAEDDIIDDFLMIEINAHYGNILLYKIDDIIDAIVHSENYEDMYKKLDKIEDESSRTRFGKRFSVSYKSKYEVMTGVYIRFTAHTYNSHESTNRKLADKFTEILCDLGIGYEKEDDRKVLINDRKCNDYSKSKMWCKDTHQKEEFDNLFGF